MNAAIESNKIDRNEQIPANLALTDTELSNYREIPLKVEYVFHPSFSTPATEEQLFGREAAQVEIPAWVHFPEVDEEMPFVNAKRVALSAKEEAHLFLQYNYARFRLAKLIESQNRRQSATRARQMILWHSRACHARATIVGANMALVLSMAKRTRIPNVEFSELISEGNMALLRSVEKFDVGRGFKFSTYACRAILKGFNRMATKTGRYHQHFPTEFDPELEQPDLDRNHHAVQWDESVDALREILIHNRAQLTPVERTIVMERFAIDSRGKGRTLAEVGKIVGLTNERVRQLQNLALEKIRGALDGSRVTA